MGSFIMKKNKLYPHAMPGFRNEKKDRVREIEKRVEELKRKKK